MTKIVSGLIMSVIIANGYWPLEKSQPLIDKTQTIRLAPDISKLSDGERKAVVKLIEVGQIFQKLYEQQRHPEAVSAYRALEQLNKQKNGAPATQNLVTLYRLFQGPIATTLENKREPFLPVEALKPGKNMYPWGITKEEVEQVITSAPNPDEKRNELLDLRAVVRWVNAKNVREDIAKLNKYPALQTLHPNLLDQLQRLTPRGATASGKTGLYAVPYSVAYADELIKAHGLLNEAANAVEKDDDEFARFLRNRARDLLSNDYESGDASWVTGRFKNLNAQIGSYETYDDELYGVKTFFSFVLLQSR
ncbi:MAG TPA: hypothetical protein VK893_08715, partial [Pyrinomonadaceae bacterium]|nr:hypothetical protein [Pyrinomonadaceae bacterium]